MTSTHAHQPLFLGSRGASYTADCLYDLVQSKVYDQFHQIFEADFRQIAAMYLPSSISKLFIIQNVFYGIDEESQCIRMSLVHNGMVRL